MRGTGGAGLVWEGAAVLWEDGRSLAGRTVIRSVSPFAFRTRGTLCSRSRSGTRNPALWEVAGPHPELAAPAGRGGRAVGHECCCRLRVQNNWRAFRQPLHDEIRKCGSFVVCRIFGGSATCFSRKADQPGAMMARNGSHPNREISCQPSWSGYGRQYPAVSIDSETVAKLKDPPEWPCAWWMC